MRANVGDKIIVRSAHVGEAVREGSIIEIHGPDGTPPFLVRWSDTDHEALVFPGPDSEIRHLAP